MFEMSVFELDHLPFEILPLLSHTLSHCGWEPASCQVSGCSTNSLNDFDLSAARTALYR